MRSKVFRLSLAPGALCAVALALAATAGASEVTGSLDGEPKRWQVLVEGDESTATFSPIGGAMTRLTVQAHQEGSFGAEGSISIDMHVVDGEVQNASVTWFPEAGLTPQYTVRDTQGIELESLETGERTARVVGRFSGELARLESMTGEPDERDTVSLEVYFDVEALRD